MAFPDKLGTIACTCVVKERKPVLFVSHAGGDWQMYCHWTNHDFDDEQVLRNELMPVHIAHLVALGPTLDEVAGLPPDMGAERRRVAGPWARHEDKDD